MGTPSGGRGFLLRSWWWGSGMLGTPFQNRIRILRREAGGGFTRHDLGFYSSVDCRGVFKAREPPDIDLFDICNTYFVLEYVIIIPG